MPVIHLWSVVQEALTTEELDKETFALQLRGFPSLVCLLAKTACSSFSVFALYLEDPVSQNSAKIY